MITLIFAVAMNNVIGKGNKLPWHMPNDLKFFKSKTLHHPVIMGRKTYESMGKPLKDRTNIIITSDQTYQVQGCIVAHSVDEAINKAKEIHKEEIFVIGGARVFEEALPYSDKIYLTEIKEKVDGDVFFNFDRSPWREVTREDHHKDSKHAYDYSFVELLRKG